MAKTKDSDPVPGVLQKRPTREYRVLTPIKRGEDRYEPGTIIELTEAEAAAIPWAVEKPGNRE